MKGFWSYIDRKSWKAATKYKVVLWVVSLMSCLAGALLWGILRLWTLNTVDWLLCFVSYPVILSWLVVVLYGGNHEFHNGAFASPKGR